MRPSSDTPPSPSSRSRHKGDPDNEAVDRLAHRAARSKTSCREYANAQLPVDLTQVPLEALIAALAAHGFRAERADS